MKNKKPNDSNFILRTFFVHCFIHIYQAITTNDITNVFRRPRFKLFKQISNKYTESQSNSLFWNILVTYKWHILRGAFITCIYVFFNLLLPELIKMFMHFMHGHHTESSQVMQTSVFIKTLVSVQILRTVFGEHSRRIFHQLSICIKSSLAKKLIQKSLNLSEKTRKDVPHSHIIQLQNVDLRLVFVMFNNMMLLIQAPLTILVALIMLFVESKTYGIIGLYWFVISFLLHRQLDNKMTHCNATKLGLIDQRSKTNYQILYGIKQARMIGWQDVIIQKNNDLFEQQNHDHYLFYFYNSLYDIILLMLPVFVVVTICLWDVGEEKHIKVQQVYMMLSLLGICYQPMKAIRTISISFHDGLHSLDRIQQYFNMPEQKFNKDKINNKISRGHLFIQKSTASMIKNYNTAFIVKTNFMIEVNPGERLVIIGRKGQGSSVFLRTLEGFVQIVQGSIRINGKKAMVSQEMFFLKASVKDNISFYNQHLSLQEIQQVCLRLNITEQLKNTGGLNSSMDDILLFSKSLLKRISLARVICSNADFYILDNPYQHLQQRYEEKVNKLLRQKQRDKNVAIIMSKKDLHQELDEDKIAIIQNGIIIEYGINQKLIADKKSKIHNYFRSKQDRQNLMSPLKKSPAIKNKFADSIRRVSLVNKAVQMFVEAGHELQQKKSKNQMKIPLNQQIKQLKISGLFKSAEERELRKLQKSFTLKHYKPIMGYLKKFILAVPLVQILLILIVIACAQFLHVFIHYWIGHLEEDHGDSSYLKFRNMMIVEVILTLGLAGVLYYQGQVSSMIAIIQGNQLYKQSLFALIKKKISYFSTQYPIKIADRFNHDYEQVFIACHGLLTIYKNLIILVVTVVFISSDGFTVLVFFAVIISVYTIIYIIFRTVENRVIVKYYDYKYDFVKCFEQSLQGAEYLHVFGYKKHLINRAQRKYMKFASYKIAQKYTNHGLLIVCDIIGNILLAIIVYYGLQVKIHHVRSKMAFIATSIHLLMNGSQVLKNILKQTINFQTFFRINLIPFLQMTQTKNQLRREKKYYEPSGHQVNFDSVILREPGQLTTQPINMKIKQGQHVLIYDQNESIRNLILYALTNNISFDTKPQQRQNGSLTIGLVKIQNIDPQQLSKTVGVIMNKNFYFTGTLRDNLVRKMEVDQSLVDKYVRLLKINEDIQTYQQQGLQSQIYFQNTKVNYQLTKKFALVRILLNKSKIVIIKDTNAFIGSNSIVDILRNNISQCTIIKISNKAQSAFGVDRIVHFQNSLKLEEGTPHALMAKQLSIMGNMLRDLDMEGYLFKNQVSRAKIFNIKVLKKS